MKNILTIDTANTCTCVLVSAYDTKTNEIIVEINLGSVLSPRLDISSTTAKSIMLKANANNQVAITSDMWLLGGSLQFRYADSAKTGDWFTINFPQTINDIYIMKDSATTFAAISKPVTPDYQAEIDALKLNKVSISDIVDNLTSTAANQPLSANQGKVLNDAITRIRGKSIFAVNDYGTGASKTGSSVSLWTGSATLTHGFYIAIISAVISTNKNTSRIELLANGNALMAGRTNSTTYERVFAAHSFGVSGEQSFNFELVAKSQDSSTTVTVPGYRTYNVLIFKVG